ncbi:DUF2306 domain-containing protein [Shewanella chilikensis]|uniref:DUF2306 domain-containing protein n=1 Tax=Shewanella chilikensis TaxID=558541 RepID=UPI003A982508
MEFFYQGSLGAIHSLCALIALITGFVVLLRAKGTIFHRKLGYVYAIAMIGLNVSAIPITGLFGGIGPFHIFILMSLPTVLVGLYLPIFGRHHKNWIRNHFECMTYSYIGLISAAIAEILIRVPLAMAVSSMSQYVIAIFVLGGIVGLIGYVFVVKYRAKNFS